MFPAHLCSLEPFVYLCCRAWTVEQRVARIVSTSKSRLAPVLLGSRLRLRGVVVVTVASRSFCSSPIVLAWQSPDQTALTYDLAICWGGQVWMTYRGPAKVRSIKVHQVRVYLQRPGCCDQLSSVSNRVSSLRRFKTRLGCRVQGSGVIAQLISMNEKSIEAFICVSCKGLAFVAILFFFARSHHSCVPACRNSVTRSTYWRRHPRVKPWFCRVRNEVVETVAKFYLTVLQKIL